MSQVPPRRGLGWVERATRPLAGATRAGHFLARSASPVFWKPDASARHGRLALRARDVSGGSPETTGGPPVPPGPLVIRSTIPLQSARTAPLSTEKLREHLGRFGERPYELSELRYELEGEVILPIGELNRMRRQLADALNAAFHRHRAESSQTWRDVFRGCDAPSQHVPTTPSPQVPTHSQRRAAETCRDEVRATGGQAVAATGLPAMTLAVLARTMEQIEAALDCGVATLYADFEDIRRYRDAVALVRNRGARRDGVGARCDEATPKAGTLPQPRILLATPRIQKAGEQGFFKLIENAAPDGVLIRNLGAIDYFRGNTALQRVGDFSLNVANPLAAQHFIAKGLERVTISYDLNVAQVLDLLAAAPPAWFELTLHQHMPLFHMEHCVFAAFMSKGSSFLDCGRPCDRHRVHLRDRVGVAHPLRADVGCRNTLFNAVPQTGAQFFEALMTAGLRNFRVELLEENVAETRRVVRAYQELLSGAREGGALWRELKAQSQIGVTKGTLDPK